MKRIMVDLETLGLSPGCIILSLGAGTFDTDTGEVGEDRFYQVISQESCLHSGLRAERAVLKWWEDQPVAARAVLHESLSQDTAIPLAIVLENFNLWVKRLQTEEDELVEIWGNGSDFDNAILQYTYRLLELPTPYTGYNARCYRTLKSIVPSIELIRQGTHHNALDDALSQAEHAVAIIESLTS